jgi:transporter family protein
MPAGPGMTLTFRHEFCVRSPAIVAVQEAAVKLWAAWQTWAILSAAFAALTAIFAKIGIENVNSDFATFVRTIVILCALGAILIGTGQWQSPASVSGRSYIFLVLSGLATGASWICYFRALKLGDAARVAPVDKMSVVLVAIFGVLFLGERMAIPNWTGIAFIAVGAVLVAYKF